MKSSRRVIALLILSTSAACGGGGSSGDAAPVCHFPLTFEQGGDGQAEPLGAAPGQARAGRIEAAELPTVASGLAVWSPGDFVLANDRVAIVIEDVGPSDLYDPWGGRPVGVARVAGGQLVDPADFGEILMLTGRYSVVTTSVTVLHDGADGQAAVVRAAGTAAPTPFLENIVGGLFREEYTDIPTAFDYVLAPDSDVVEVYAVYRSPRLQPSEQPFTMHGFMFTPRMATWAPGMGFETENQSVPYLAFVDDDGASYAYGLDGASLDPGINASGFMSLFSGAFTVAPCGETRRLHTRLTIGGAGVGLDGLVASLARADGTALRAVTGVVRDANGTPAPGVRVHAQDMAGGYLTRATSDATGAYTIHVPAQAAVQLTAYRRGDLVVGPLAVAADGTTQDFALAPGGFVHVVAHDADSGLALPARIQILPEGESGVPTLPGNFGEPTVAGGRLHVDYPLNGETTLRVPAGDWEVVVSRGYEYELVRQSVTVAAGATVEVTAPLTHVVDTAGAQCGDFHIHTARSNDSGDDAAEKVRSAAADGLELPIRSEHEYVASFQPLIEELGLTPFAFGVGSIEMTSMEIWGHMGVVPLDPDPTQVNGGAPLWQRYPSATDLATVVETLSPPTVFAAVRQRPEQPVIIINHPRGGSNYFDYAGYDRLTGLASAPDQWDEDFTVVEVFNDSDWLGSRTRTVADWLSFLDHGRRVFAVGSSDSHGIRTSPVGYPRTCLALGTDDPQALTADMIRDATAAGNGTISGGVYVDTWVGPVRPGGQAMGLGATANVRVRVQAASWVDVDWIDIVVDGQTVDTIAILPGDADPLNPTIRFDKELPIDVAATGEGYVIVAAYGDAALEPVHPGRTPFGVTNPIFVAP